MAARLLRPSTPFQLRLGRLVLCPPRSGPPLRTTLPPRPSPVPPGSSPSNCIMASSTLYRPGDQESDGIDHLFRAVEAAFPPSLRTDGWYLTMVSTLIACGLQRHTGDLYMYLTSQPRYQSPAQRKALALRLREAHFKSIMISGIPKVMDSIASLAAVEREEDQDHTMTRQEWQLDKANHERGSRVLDTLFKGMNDGIRSSWGSHREISWISINISYGLFLADHRILNIVETELVVLPGIMCQNLGRETSWHVRASQNVGITPQDVQAVQRASNLVAEFAGLELSNVKG